MYGKFENLASGQVEIRVGRPDGTTETHIHPPDCDFEFNADLPGDYHITHCGQVYTVSVDLGVQDGVTVKVSKSAFGEVVTVNEFSDELRSKMIEHVVSLANAKLEALGVSVGIAATLGHDWNKLVDTEIRDEILSFAGFRGAACTLHARPETHDRTRKAILAHMEKTPMPAPYLGFGPGVVQAPIASPYPGKSMQWHSPERMDRPEGESKPKRKQHTDKELRNFVSDMNPERLDDLSVGCGWGERPAELSDADFSNLILANAGLVPSKFYGYMSGEPVDRRRAQLSEALDYWTSLCKVITSRTSPPIANTKPTGGGSVGSIPWTHGFGMVGRDGPKIYGLVTPEEAKAESEHKRMTTSQNMHINVLGRKDATPIVRDEFSFTAPDGSGERFTFYDDGDISVSKRGMESLHVKFEAWRKKSEILEDGLAEAKSDIARMQDAASKEFCERTVDQMNVYAELASLKTENAMLRRALYGNGKARVTVDNGWDD